MSLLLCTGFIYTTCVCDPALTDHVIETVILEGVGLHEVYIRT